MQPALREKPFRAVAWSAAFLLAGALFARYAGIGWATVDVGAHLPGSDRDDAARPRAPALPGAPRRVPAEEAVVAEPSTARPGSPEEAAGAHAIEDPRGAMRSFYSALAATDGHRSGAVTRIGHWGDSLLDADLVTGALRRSLQKRFGDAGHGFVLAGTPWPGYRHWDVRVSARGPWTVSRSTNSIVPDAHYGLGGVAFRTRARGAVVAFATDGEGEVGRTATRIEIHYLRQPGGGALEVTGPSGIPVTLGTAAEARHAGFHSVEARDGAMRVEARVAGGGEVRLFGAVLERSVSGVAYDALGINGARARILLRFDEAHFAETLRHRALDLVVLQFGINESEAEHLRMSEYRDVLERVIRRFRSALPEASCLVVGPVDRAGRDRMGRMRTRPIILRLREAQRTISLEEGCAFWDALAAQGGEDAAVRWFRLGLLGGDFTHVTPRGGVKLADLLYRALLHGYYTRPSSGR